MAPQQHPVPKLGKNKSMEFYLYLCGTKGSEKYELIKLCLSQPYSWNLYFNMCISVYDLNHQHEETK